MTDDDLLHDFTDVRKVPNGISIRVRRITWPHPHEPRARWHTVVRLPIGTSRTDLDEARRRLLDDTKHFRVCAECHERNPSGRMHDDFICQLCAERNHGVVY